MTRTARELSWDGQRAPRLPATLEGGGFRFRLTESEGHVLASGPDLWQVAAIVRAETARAAAESLSDAFTQRAVARRVAELPEVRRELSLVTGSHHYLAFWLASGEERELRQLPFVFLLAEQSWAPRAEVFLQPPEAPPYVPAWNSGCIQCHAVAGRPRESESREPSGSLTVRYQTEVAELGIACEACHGPGKEHAAHFRSPWSRWRIHHGGTHEGELPNPGHLGAELGSAVCGQCHGYFVPKDEARWWDSGYVGLFSPGETLARSRVSLQPSAHSPDVHAEAEPWLSRELGSIFWGDGTTRVGGREYDGLLASACYQRGSGERQLGCTSCHSMHDSEPDDQLTRASERDPNAPCLSCHHMSAGHSHHRLGSPGDSCVECHMPKTTYALQKGIRSHRIQSPSFALADPPSPCVLCHVDRSAAWIQRELRAWSAEPSPEPAAPPEETTLSPSEGARQALADSAAVRAIFAAQLGSPEVLAASGTEWSRQLLGVLAEDPYAVVRRMARRSLERLPSAGATSAPLPSSTIERLRAARDDTPVVISE